MYCLQCIFKHCEVFSRSFDEWTRKIAYCIMTGIIHSVMYTVLCILFVGRIHFKVIMNTPLAIKTLQFSGNWKFYLDTDNRIE